MSNAKLGCLLIAGATLVSGCSTLKNNPLYGENGLIKDRSKEYKNVVEADRLVIPPHLMAKQTQESMELPKRNINTAGAIDTVTRPDYFYADTGTESVNLKQEQDTKLLLVDSPMNQIWPKAQQFMDFNNLGISNVDPRQGTIESDWVIVKVNQPGVVESWFKKLTFQSVEGDSKNKIRINLKPYQNNPNRTQITIDHVSYQADAAIDEIDWNNDSNDITYKNDMLYELLRFMSKSTNGARNSGLLASTFKRSLREGSVFFGRNANGKPALKITGGLDNAWNLIDRSLITNEIDVGTRDRAGAAFYLTFTSLAPVQQEKRGFFEWLHGERGPITFSTFVFGGDDDQSSGEEVLYSSQGQLASSKELQLTDKNHPANQPGFKVWLGGKVLYNFNRGFNTGFFNLDTNLYEITAGYKLRISHRGDANFVTVLDKEGNEAANTPASELLWRIKDGIPR